MKKTHLMKLVLLSMSASLIFGCQQVSVKDRKKLPENNLDERETTATTSTSTPEVHTVKCSATTTVTNDSYSTGGGHMMDEKAKAMMPPSQPMAPMAAPNEPAKCSTRNIPPAELPTGSPTSALVEESVETAHIEIAPEIEELI